MMRGLDNLDHRLLDAFQRDLPLVPRPYAAMGEQLGISEAEVITRLARLKTGGLVSRVGATIRPNTAGSSTLAAMAVPPGRIEEVAAIVGAEAGVNHSYLRDDDWNLWFVATAPDAAALERTLARISERAKLRVLDLRLVRPFNIDLGFSLSGGQTPARVRPPLRREVLTPEDAPLLQALSEGLALVPDPFAVLAASLNLDEHALLDRLRILQAAGIITRLGVIVLHRGMGWTANAMIVWDIAEEGIAEAGPLAAGCPGVTLCYQRRTVPGLWPYALYTMVHARTRDEALAVLDTLRALPPFSGVPHRVLFSTRCFKQTGALLHRREAAA